MTRPTSDVQPAEQWRKGSPRVEAIRRAVPEETPVGIVYDSMPYAVVMATPADIEDLAGVPVRRRMHWGSMSVFMNAPGLQVPYHFDHETNFLMQIRGEKYVRLYPKGRATLCEEEIEDFYRFNALAGRYRDELAEAGTLYTLTPGVGVHHPPLAPHLIRNGCEVSVSLAIYYVMSEMEYRARVYQVNFCMRKMGLHPRPPGESPWVDAAKERLIRALSMSHPRTHDEMLYSGIRRLTAPARMAPTTWRWVTPRPSRCCRGCRAMRASSAMAA